jgi:hypothetical protein
MEADAKNEQFQEVGHAGGTLVIRFEAGEHGHPGGVGTRFSFSRPSPCSVMQMGASLDGLVLAFWPVYGVDSRTPPEPSPMVPVLLISDREGMWGRTCPKCAAYFRTNQAGNRAICPYCAHQGRTDQFTTENQRMFVARIVRAYIEAGAEKKESVLDLDQIADSLPENRPKWAYSEERQQNRFKCRSAGCGALYDVLGEYAGCPACGRRNSSQVLDCHLDELNEEMNLLGGARDEVVQWEKLARCFSDFEAMAKDIQNQLALFPATPRRRHEVEGLSFQRFAQAEANLEKWFGLRLTDGVAVGERTFMIKMLKRRHLFVHNGGRVDQDYLDQTGDTSVRLHEQLDVRRSEIYRLLPVLRKSAANLFAGYESMLPRA